MRHIPRRRTLKAWAKMRRVVTPRCCFSWNSTPSQCDVVRVAEVGGVGVDRSSHAADRYDTLVIFFTFFSFPTTHAQTLKNFLFTTTSISHYFLQLFACDFAPPQLLFSSQAPAFSGRRLETETGRVFKCATRDQYRTRPDTAPSLKTHHSSCDIAVCLRYYVLCVMLHDSCRLCQPIN